MYIERIERGMATLSIWANVLLNEIATQLFADEFSVHFGFCSLFRINKDSDRDGKGEGELYFFGKCKVCVFLCMRIYTAMGQ